MEAPSEKVRADSPDLFTPAVTKDGTRPAPDAAELRPGLPCEPLDTVGADGEPIAWAIIESVGEDTVTAVDSMGRRHTLQINNHLAVPTFGSMIDRLIPAQPIAINEEGPSPDSAGTADQRWAVALIDGLAPPVHAVLVSPQPENQWLVYALHDESLSSWDIRQLFLTGAKADPATQQKVAARLSRLAGYSSALSPSKFKRWDLVLLEDTKADPLTAVLLDHRPDGNWLVWEVQREEFEVWAPREFHPTGTAAGIDLRKKIEKVLQGKAPTTWKPARPAAHPDPFYPALVAVEDAIYGALDAAGHNWWKGDAKVMGEIDDLVLRPA
jgi:hypothetical protein